LGVRRVSPSPPGASPYSRLIRAVALKAGLTESEAKDVEQETLLCVAKTIHTFEANPARGTFKSWLFNLTRCCPW
jgi:RNA polymerase sigma-70 factor (ECF subfamily)